MNLKHSPAAALKTLRAICLRGWKIVPHLPLELSVRPRQFWVCWGRCSKEGATKQGKCVDRSQICIRETQSSFPRTTAFTFPTSHPLGKLNHPSYKNGTLKILPSLNFPGQRFLPVPPPAPGQLYPRLRKCTFSLPQSPTADAPIGSLEPGQKRGQGSCQQLILG